MPAKNNDLISVQPSTATFTPSGGTAVSFGACQEFLISETATSDRNQGQDNPYPQNGGCDPDGCTASLVHRDATNHYGTTIRAGTKGGLVITQKARGDISTTCTITIASCNVSNKSEGADGRKKSFTQNFDLFSSDGSTFYFTAVFA